MSVHINAKVGEIAPSVLLPGDPLRAKFIADHLLENAVCYNQVRGMFGYTGTYKGKKVSVQGTGMGMPSMAIYSDELINFYGVKQLIRIGTCGSIQEDIKVRDVVLAMSASTNSSFNKLRFKGMDFASTANFDLLMKAYNAAKNQKVDVKVGNVFSSDTFYSEDPEYWALWKKYGVLAIEMEAAALYTLAARYGVQALAILTVSDHIVLGEFTEAEEREKTFMSMAKIALETI